MRDDSLGPSPPGSTDYQSLTIRPEQKMPSLSPPLNISLSVHDELPSPRANPRLVKTVSQQQRLREGYWACAHCTFLNHPEMLNCEMCEHKKNVLQDKLIDLESDTKQPPSPYSLSMLEPLPSDNPTSVRAISNLVVQAFSSSQSEAVEQDFFCAICQSNNPMVDAVTTSSICQHKCCRDCLSAFLSFEIKEGRVLGMCCPCMNDEAKKHCDARFTDSLIKELVDAETMSKYERFVKMKQDESYRQCPSCQNLQKGNPSHPSMTCEHCDKRFCYHHSDAHPGTSCAVYNAKNRDAFIANRKFVDKKTIRCPDCRAPILKSSGCNHMTCATCKCNFCYLCGGLYMSGQHFRKYPAWNVLYACPGKQSSGGEAGERATCCWKLMRLVCTIPLFLCLFLSIVVPIVAFGLWAGCFFGLLPCCMFALWRAIRRDKNEAAALLCFGPWLVAYFFKCCFKSFSAQCSNCREGHPCTPCCNSCFCC